MRATPRAGITPAWGPGQKADTFNILTLARKGSADSFYHGRSGRGIFVEILASLIYPGISYICGFFSLRYHGFAIV
jgi:hypothetical protein